MRSIGTILAVAMILLAVLLALLRWGPFAEKPGLREPTLDKGESATTVQVPAKGARKSVVSGRDHLKSSSVETTPSPEIASAGQTTSLGALSTSAAGKETRNFPTAADIAIGTDRAKLQTTFIRPNMRTSVVERGRFLETLVYLQNDPETVTFVLLRDGKVVSVNTTVY